MDLDWDKVEKIQEQQSQPEEPQMLEEDSEWIYEDVFEDEDEDPAVSEAIKRIEQAKLYESLLKHDFFGPGSARPEIQNKVTKEIRDFILERLTILVGINSPKPQQSSPVSLPWSDIQIQAITAMANRLVDKKATNKSPARPVVQPFGGGMTTPVVNVAPIAEVIENTPQPEAQTSPVSQNKRKKRRVRKATAKSDESVLPEGTKVDPSTGRPMSDSGAVLYKGQVTNKKNPPKKMPPQGEIDRLHSSQVAKAQTGTNTIGNKMLGLAITSSQHNNRSIIEE